MCVIARTVYRCKMPLFRSAQLDVACCDEVCCRGGGVPGSNVACTLAASNGLQHLFVQRG